MVTHLLLAGLLVAHAAIHAMFLAPQPPATASDQTWPFQLDHSWVLDRVGVDIGPRRVVAIGLLVVTLVGFGSAALAALQIGPAALWVSGATVGAVGSMALLLMFFHPWLVLGLAIDVAILIAVRGLDWTPAGGL